MNWHFPHVLKWPHKNLNLTKEILNSWKLWNERCRKVDLYKSTDSAMSSGSQCGYFWAPWLLFSIFKPAKGHGGHDFDEGVWTLALQKRALGIFLALRKRQTQVKHGLKGRWPRWPRWPRSVATSLELKIHDPKTSCGQVLPHFNFHSKFFSSLYVLHWHVWYVGLRILKGVIMTVKKESGNRTWSQDTASGSTSWSK